MGAHSDTPRQPGSRQDQPNHIPELNSSVRSNLRKAELVLFHYLRGRSAAGGTLVGSQEHGAAGHRVGTGSSGKRDGDWCSI